MSSNNLIASSYPRMQGIASSYPRMQGIEPFVKCEQILKYYKIISINIILSVSASFGVNIFDSEGGIASSYPRMQGKVILFKSFIMSGSDYEKWGTDDLYVYEWINKQIQNINN